MRLKWSSSEGFAEYGAFWPWHPLMDEGQAIRLAATVGVSFAYTPDGVSVNGHAIALKDGETLLAALCRGIVQAAAETHEQRMGNS